MNVEHCERVKRVLAETAGLLGHLLHEMEMSQAVYGACVACAELWRREFPEEEGLGTRVPLDLSGAGFSGAVFAQLMGQVVRLNRADFRGAQLDDTRWLFVHIKHANFEGASMQRCYMLGTACESAVFRRADLSGADLDIVIMEDDPPADLRQANLTDARLRFHGVTPLLLEGAVLDRCRIRCFTDSTNPVDIESAERGRRHFLASLTDEQRAQVTFEEPGDEAAKAGTQCFLATAAFGSEKSPQVVRLREFRDRVLRRSTCGRLVVRAYEAVSPPLARWVARSALARALVRALIVRPCRAIADRALAASASREPRDPA